MSTTVAWGEPIIAQWREAVAPLKKNFWNTLDEDILNSKLGWVFVVISMAGIVGGIWLSESYPVFGIVGVGFFFLLYAAYKLAAQLKAKPAIWERASLSAFLDEYASSASTRRLLKEAIDAERRRNPNADFEVEYLASPAAVKRTRPNEAIVLWSRVDPFESLKKRWAILAIKDGVVASEFGS